MKKNTKTKKKIELEDVLTIMQEGFLKSDNRADVAQKEFEKLTTMVKKSSTEIENLTIMVKNGFIERDNRADIAQKGVENLNTMVKKSSTEIEKPPW
jgi:hypothetical protein